MLNLRKLFSLILLSSISFNLTYSMEEEFSEPETKKSKTEFDFEDIEKSNVSSLKDLSLLEVLYTSNSSHLLPAELLNELINLANEQADVSKYSQKEIEVFKEIAESCHCEFGIEICKCLYQETINQLLIKAILNNHTAIASFVIYYGAEVNAKDEYGYSALMLAALRNNKSILNLLLSFHACMDETTSNGRTALMYAADCGYTEIVDLLISKGANIELKDKYRNTAIDFALRSGNKETILLFFPDEKLAMSSALSKKIEFLLRKNKKDSDTHSALLLLNTVSKFLLNSDQHELFTNFSESIFNDSLKGGSTLIQAAKKGHKNLVRVLINQGINCNTRNFNGNLPIIAASYNGHLEVVKILAKGTSRSFLGNRADLNLANFEKKTALMAATAIGHFKIVKYLTDNGAWDNDTALSKAAEFQDESMFCEIAQTSQWFETTQIIQGLISDGYRF